MNTADLFGEIGLVVFAAIFAGVLVYAFSRRNRATFDRARRAPLEDGRRVSRGDPGHE